MSGLLFGTEFNRLEAALSAREKLQSIRSANIANADTPNYKADTRTFKEIFHSMVGDEGGALAKTDPGHMSFSGDHNLEVFSARAASDRMDGNSVNVQHEMEKLAENQMMHEYTLRLIEDRLSGLKKAIKDGGQY